MNKNLTIIMTVVIIAIVAIAGFVTYSMLQTPSSIRKLRLVWAETDPNTVESMAAIIKDFEAANPNVIVQPEYVAWGDLSTKMYSAVRAGSEPELMGAEIQLMMDFAKNDIILPLDDLVESIGKSDFYSGVLSQMLYGDHYYGLLSQVADDVIFYRKDWFAAAGISVPTNWETWLAAVKALTNADHYGIGFSGKAYWMQFHLMCLFRTAQGRCWTTDLDPTINTTDMYYALSMLKELTKYCPPGWETWAHQDRAIAFAQGQIAMVPGQGRWLSIFEKYGPSIADPSKIGVFRWPVSGGWNGSKAGQQYAYMDTDPMWVIPKNCKYPDLAKAFLKYLMTGKEYINYAQSVPGHLNPVLKSVRNNPDYWSSSTTLTTWKNEITFMLDAVDEGVSWDISKETPNEINPYMGKIMGAMILDDLGINVAVKGNDIQKEMDLAQKRALDIYSTLPK